MVLLTITVDVLKKNHSEFFQTLISLGQEVRRYPGCVSYEVFQSLEAGNHISLELEWVSNETMRSYINSRTFSITMGAIKTFCIAPKIRIGQLAVVEHQDLINNDY